MKIKQVSVRDGLDGPLVPLARFYLDGDTVITQWQNESYRRDIERNGIIVLASYELKRLRPDDGKLFFDSLDLAYSQSSLMTVEEI